MYHNPDAATLAGLETEVLRTSARWSPRGSGSCFTAGANSWP